MAGGSTDPEHPTDGQCPQCGLWYRDVGVSMKVHEASCDGTPKPKENTSEVAPDELKNASEVDRHGTIAEPDPGRGPSNIDPDPTPGMGGLPADEPPEREDTDPYVCPDCGHDELVDVRPHPIRADFHCEKCGGYYHDE